MMDSWRRRETLMDLLSEENKAGTEGILREKELLEEREKNSGIRSGLLEKYLQELELLKNIPLEYLIPDEKLLPNESIRFFFVDENWVACVLDGAGSVDRTTTFDLVWDGQWMNDRKDQDVLRTGFILRSEMIRICKGLKIQAIGGKENGEEVLPFVRLEQLGEEILLGIVEGKIEGLRVTQPEEGLTFGFVEDKDGALVLPVVPLFQREIDGNRMSVRRGKDRREAAGDNTVTVPMRQCSLQGVVDLEQLMEKITWKWSEEEREKAAAVELAAELLDTPWSISLKGVKM